MALRIGIDLDNTLIDYGPVLASLARQRAWITAATPAHKTAIRAALVAADGDDRRWQALQAAAYGLEIGRALPYAGAVEFVRGALAAGHVVFVLSHKSERSHFDPRVELRDAARAWLASVGLVASDALAPEHVFFFDDLDAKVRAIAALACDWMIDDLPRVLVHPGVPPATVRVWFAPDARPAADGALVPCSSFDEVRVLLTLRDALDVTPTPALRAALGPRPSAVETMREGGNARLRRVVDADGSRRVVKVYRRDGRPRAEREARALAWMHARGEVAVPTLLHSDPAAGVAVLEMIEGDAARSDDAAVLMDACADFALRLASDLGEVDHAAFGPASEARLRLGDHPRAIEARLARVVAAGAAHPEARALIETRLKPLVRRAVEQFHDRVARSQLDLEAELPWTEQIPSPSDLGLHNLLVDRNHDVRFLDFEYFGWDDPAKLMADVLHSIAFDAPAAARRRFVERLCAGLHAGVHAARRLAVIEPLIRVEWILIVLGVLDDRDARAADAARVAARIARAAAMVEAIA